jgi:alcohol dehydrogenase YqhD (iron-dependent ADH family)
LIKRAVLVYCVAVIVFGRIEWQKFLSRRYPHDPEEDEQVWDEVHARNAKLVEQTIRKLRGFWVKVGLPVP